MRLSAIRLGVLLVPSCLVAAGAASAQPAGTATRASQPQLRSQIAIMEGVLERAVGEGIRGAVGQMPDVFSGPGMFVSPPRARGFRIDGYGVFFDVEVPTLPASITWSISVLNRNNQIAVVNDLNQVRAMVQGLPDARRVELLKALDRVQSRVSGAALSEPGVPPAQGATPASLKSAPANNQVVAPFPEPARDPSEVYTTEVRKALTNVMLEQGIAMQLGPDEWFTIAASESRGGWGEPDTMTMYLSLQGKDLAALRAKQITPEEAARRIVVKSY